MNRTTCLRKHYYGTGTAVIGDDLYVWKMNKILFVYLEYSKTFKRNLLKMCTSVRFCWTWPLFDRTDKTKSFGFSKLLMDTYFSDNLYHSDGQLFCVNYIFHISHLKFSISLCLCVSAAEGLSYASYDKCITIKTLHITLRTSLPSSNSAQKHIHHHHSRRHIQTNKSISLFIFPLFCFHFIKP